MLPPTKNNKLTGTSYTHQKREKRRKIIAIRKITIFFDDCHQNTYRIYMKINPFWLHLRITTSMICVTAKHRERAAL